MGNEEKQEQRKESKEKKEMVTKTAELDRRDQVTPRRPWTRSFRKGGGEVDSQVAAPTGSKKKTEYRGVNLIPLFFMRFRGPKALKD